MAFVLEAIDLAKTYQTGGQEIRALDGLSLQVERGEFIAIMGRSGSGKTTLLNMIGCLDSPDSGRVFLEGQEVSSLPRAQLPRIRREKVGFVFQHFNLIPTLMALENVMLPLKYAHVSRAASREQAVEMLKAVDMERRMIHRPSELSGGEQQRVAIARALVNKPAVVLADEPTGEMDTQTATTILELMQRLNRERQQTFLVVTHDPLVAEHAKKVVRLKDGKIESITTVGRN